MSAALAHLVLPGRHLREMAASPFVALLPELLVSGLELQGFVLRPLTRPYLARTGQLSVKLVWRRGGASVAINWTVKTGISDELLDMIDRAMAPPEPLIDG